MLKLSTLLATVCLFSGPVMAADKIGETAGQGNPLSNTDCPKDISDPCIDRSPGEKPPSELWLLEVFKKSNNHFCYSPKAPLKLIDDKSPKRQKESLSLSPPKSTDKIEKKWFFEKETLELPTANLTSPQGANYLLQIEGIPAITLHEVPEQYLSSDNQMAGWMRQQGCVLQVKYLENRLKGK